MNFKLIISEICRYANNKHFYSDIVDTTPADGNIWKMLLGSINDWADDDDEDAEDNGPGYHERLANDIDALGIGRSS